MAGSHSTSNNDEKPHHQDSWLFSRTGLVTVGVVAILGFLVYTGHSAHLLGFAPFLLLLACPLMHVFMHGGHRRHRTNNHNDSNGRAESFESPENLRAKSSDSAEGQK